MKVMIKIRLTNHTVILQSPIRVRLINKFKVGKSGSDYWVAFCLRKPIRIRPRLHKVMETEINTMDKASLEKLRVLLTEKANKEVR